MEGVVHAKDFRPISLIHSFAKLVTKILVNRLASRLEDMVSTNQSAFIKGRFVQDNFMLMQQTTRLKDRPSAVVKSPHLCQEVLGSTQPLCIIL
jgi:hypothetical protein